MTNLILLGIWELAMILAGAFSLRTIRRFMANPRVKATVVDVSSSRGRTRVYFPIVQVHGDPAAGRYRAHNFRTFEKYKTGDLITVWFDAHATNPNNKVLTDEGAATYSTVLWFAFSALMPVATLVVFHLSGMDLRVMFGLV